MVKQLIINRQGGQAMAEFSAMLIVFVPLILIVPLMGKISDMNQSTIQASRYAAWERTVAAHSAKSEVVLNAEARRRFFGNTDAFIKTNEGPIDGDDYRNVLWRDHRGDWLLAHNEWANVGTEERATPGWAASATGSAIRLAYPGLNEDGYYHANIGVNVGSSNVQPFDQGKDCNGTGGNAVFTCINRKNVILADTWSASSPGQVRDRVQERLPMHMIRDIKTLTDLFSWIPLMKELKGFQPGYVAPDVVPQDRLSIYQE